MKSSLFVLLVTSLLVGASPEADWPQPLPPDEPDLDNLTFGPYGDRENVARLVEVMASEDPVEREHAVRDLGQTHHLDALPAIRKAQADDAAIVRAAAAIAAGEFDPRLSNELLVAALQDPNATVTNAALAVIRRDGRKRLGKQVEQLLDAEDLMVRTAALRCLTSLDIAADSDLLAGLLREGGTRVRLYALQNALLLADGGSVVGLAARDAGDASTALRARSVPLLGKFAFRAHKDLIARSADGDIPALRAAAVHAYRLAGQGDLIRPFYDKPGDPEEVYPSVPGPVQLAVAKAAGELNLTDAIGFLMEALQDPRTAHHEAAVASLHRLGSEPCARPVAYLAREILGRYGQKPPPPLAVYERGYRDLTACCELLAAYGYGGANDDFLQFVSEKGDIANDRIVPLMRLLSLLGDERIVKPGKEILRNGEGAARKILAGAIPPPPYDDRVPAAILRSLGRLRPEGAFDMIKKWGTLSVGRARLYLPANAAIFALMDLRDADNAAPIDETLVQLLEDVYYSRRTRIHAMWAAGKLKIPAAQKELRAIVEFQRDHPTSMEAAAWALMQITGEPPTLPDATPNPDDDWIIRRVRRPSSP